MRFSADFLAALVLGAVILAALGAVGLLTLLVRDLVRRTIW